MVLSTVALVRQRRIRARWSIIAGGVEAHHARLWAAVCARPPPLMFERAATVSGPCGCSPSQLCSCSSSAQVRTHSALFCGIKRRLSHRKLQTKPRSCFGFFLALFLERRSAAAAVRVVRFCAQLGAIWSDPAGCLCKVQQVSDDWTDRLKWIGCPQIKRCHTFISIRDCSLINLRSCASETMQVSLDKDNRGSLTSL